MKEIYKDFLFAKHILVSEQGHEQTVTSAFNVVVTLGQKFGIRVTNPLFANIDMVKVASRNLGTYVPEPFYRGFPRTVLELTPSQLRFDQLLHYTQTYGWGWFDEPGHSVIEDLKPEDVNRIVYNEQLPPKDFTILEEKDALITLRSLIKNLLAANRPLSVSDHALIAQAWSDFGPNIIPEWMACKDTVIFMLCETKSLQFCKFLKLSDVIKVLFYIQYYRYQSENLKKLNLKNKDRVFITKIINEILRLDYAENKNTCNFMECFEKRKIWCGLFHHIHYKIPHEYLDPSMRIFIDNIRSNKNYSAYHDFEYYMRNGHYSTAARTLVTYKGKSALVRNLNYILSRCKTDEEIKEVLEWLA